MTPRNDIAALVLAAGYSSRMEQFKPLLPVGPTTALERCIDLFRGAGVRDVRVVVGHRAAEVQPLLDRLEIRSIMNARFSEGMFSSVQAGLGALGSGTRAFFLLPVDIPLIRRTTVLDLMAGSDANPDGIWIPSFRGRRGHPPLIAMKWGPGILSWSGGGGLRGFMRNHPDDTLELPVADEHVSMDMDTPGDYARLLAAAADYDVPSASECMVLLDETFRVGPAVVAHSRKVAEVALLLARSLNSRGHIVDEKLIVAAALLHDLAKGQPNHPEVAAQALRELGYASVADVVASHMDMEPLVGVPLSPQEIVCFADKIVQADAIVSVKERFDRMLARSAHDPLVAERVAQRLSHITGIQARLEAALGSSIDSVLASTVPGPEGDRLENLLVEAR